MVEGSTPQHYAAYTRNRKRFAKAEQISLAKCELAVPTGFPMEAAVNGEEIAATARGGSVLEPLRTLASIALDHPDKKNNPHFLEGKTIRNMWTAHRMRGNVLEQREVYIIIENPDAPKNERRTYHWCDGDWLPSYRTQVWMLYNTFRTSRYIYGFAEERALKKLRSLVTPFIYERYMLTGVLLEVGKSGVEYYIRKGRPTLAFRLMPSDVDPGAVRLQPLAALCTHPGAYFHRTWTGILPPTDEVIAHLLHIRSSEHRFWKISEQHRIDAIETGL